MSNEEISRRGSTNRQLMKTIQQRTFQVFEHLNNIHRVLIEGTINGKKE